MNKQKTITNKSERISCKSFKIYVLNLITLSGEEYCNAFYEDNLINNETLG